MATESFTHRARASLAAFVEGAARAIAPKGGNGGNAPLTPPAKMPIPAHVSGKGAQAANVAALTQKSQTANAQPLSPSQPRTPQRVGKAGVTNIEPSVTGQEDDELQALMLTNMAPQATQAGMLAPGAPLPTVPDMAPEEGPRQRQYTVGENINPTPRAGEASSFSQLRNLALLYEGIQLCEQVWFDVINRLQPLVKFKPGVIPDGESESDPKWRAVAEPAEQWLKRPDRVLTLHQWMTASVRDVLELGHGVIFTQRNRIGQILSLDNVDAATVKVLIDERGRTPSPPFPAFQQVVYGLPGGRYTTDEMLLIRETARTDSSYSFSRVERIIMRVNMALRKEHLDLTRYTEGSMPEGVMFPPLETNWSPEQCERYEARINNLIAGNDKLKVRLKVGIPGATIEPTKPDDPDLAFDEYLLNVTVAAFGLTMDELGMTATSNRSVGQSQENVIYRRTVQPIAQLYKEPLTDAVQELFDPRLYVDFGGFDEKEDLLVKAQTMQIGVSTGAISPSFMAREMGWRVDSEVPPFVMTKDGPLALEDWHELRQAQLDAKRAGLEFAAASPGGVMPTEPGSDDGGDGEEEDDDESGDNGGSPKPGQPKTPPSDKSDDKSDDAGDDGKSDDDEQDQPAKKPVATRRTTTGRLAHTTAIERKASKSTAKKSSGPKAKARLSNTGGERLAQHVSGARTAAHDLSTEARRIFDEVSQAGHTRLP